MGGFFMRVLTGFAAAAAAALLAAAAASAADAPPQQASFKDVIARGMKIVGTTSLTAEANKTTNAVVIVTLQLDKTVAVCTFSIGAWENMNASLQDDAKACDVR